MAKRIEFPIPNGFTVPEGIGPDEDIESVCTVRLKPDGKTMCLVKLQDAMMPGYRDEDDEDTYAEAAAKHMEAGQY